MEKAKAEEAAKKAKALRAKQGGVKPEAKAEAVSREGLAQLAAVYCKHAREHEALLAPSNPAAAGGFGSPSSKRAGAGGARGGPASPTPPARGAQAAGAAAGAGVAAAAPNIGLAVGAKRLLLDGWLELLRRAGLLEEEGGGPAA